MSEPIYGPCIGCRHDFTTGPCGGCGARPHPELQCGLYDECPGPECPKCSGREPILWCDDCRAYADPLTGHAEAV